MKRPPHFDDLLSDWSFDPATLNVRLVKGKDGRDVIQMRVDMGLLQLETTGRPDGTRVEGFETYLEYLLQAKLDDPERVLTEAECVEVDREFMQFYHRRICWLRLQYYQRAVIDADHTLRLMDVSDEMSPDEEWAGTHEQYRPFVLFHRTQAEALGELEEDARKKPSRRSTAGSRRCASSSSNTTPKNTSTKTNSHSDWSISANRSAASTPSAKRSANGSKPPSNRSSTNSRRKSATNSPAAKNRDHARIDFATTPATSVSRKSRPAWRYVSRSWSKPIRCRIVACRSWTCILFSTA